MGAHVFGFVGPQVVIGEAVYSVGGGDYCLGGSGSLLPVCHHSAKNIVAPFEGPAESFFFQTNNAEDEVVVLRQLAVNMTESCQHHLGHLGQEGLGQTQPAAVADGTADNPAQHVTPAFVPWHHTVSDKEGSSPGVFRNDPQGVVNFPVLTVGTAAQFAGLVNDGPEQVGLVNVGFVLQHGGGPLQSHPRVHAGGWQGCAVSFGILVILHEYQVPHLHEALAIAVGVTPGNLLLPSRVPFPSEDGCQLVGWDHWPATLFATTVKV